LRLAAVSSVVVRQILVLVLGKVIANQILFVMRFWSAVNSHHNWVSFVALVYLVPKVLVVLLRLLGVASYRANLVIPVRGSGRVVVQMV
jgi:hypothetical protein